MRGRGGCSGMLLKYVWRILWSWCLVDLGDLLGYSQFLK